MRKTTKLACAAFIAGIPTRISNTSVTVENGVTRLYLFSNHIASKQPDGGIFVSNAGYFTNTTKERLNGIPGVTVNQKDGVWYLNGRVWDGEWTKV
jgi:hypothetical protein